MINSNSSLISVSISNDGLGTNFISPLEILGNKYFGAQPGIPYSFKIKNLTAGRLLVVTSVDGRSIMNDKPSEVSDSGYIIRPLGEIPISGYRIDDDTSAAFLPNENLERTLAAMAGGDVNKIGCVAFAIFREKDYEYRKSPTFSSEDVTRGGFTLGATKGGSVGTSVGASKVDKVMSVEFEKATSQPVEIFELNYRPLGDLKEILNNYPFDLDNKPFSKPQTGLQNYQIQ